MIEDPGGQNRSRLRPQRQERHRGSVRTGPNQGPVRVRSGFAGAKRGPGPVRFFGLAFKRGPSPVRYSRLAFKRGPSPVRLSGLTSKRSPSEVRFFGFALAEVRFVFLDLAKLESRRHSRVNGCRGEERLACGGFLTVDVPELLAGTDFSTSIFCIRFFSQIFL